jgi:TRAP-type mannitol/chloroaromatic compound transport system substrate-binding protein
MSWKAIDRYSTDYKEMQEKQGVKFWKTPDAILKRQLEVWDGVVAKKSAENPLFKKAFESQKAFAARAGRWQADTNVEYKMALNHFFPAKKKA